MDAQTNTTEVRIFLVDDHAMVRDGLRQVLRNQAGMMVVGEAGNGRLALDQIRALVPQVVIMDLHMAEGGGIAASRLILAEFPKIKIIVLSSDSKLALVTEALQAGASAYVLKENASDELVRAIRAVMDHRMYLCPELASAVLGNYMGTISDKAIPSSKPLLTDRERQLLILVAAGKRNKEIAEILGVTLKSAETFRSRLMKKLNCASSNELSRYAFREGIAQP